MRQHQQTDKGFTVVELLVISPIVILAIGAFLALIITMTGDVIASRASNILTYNVQDTLNRIETDTKLSTTFLAASPELEAGQTGQGYDDALELFYNSNDPEDPSPKGDMLILNMLATSGNPTDASSGLVYLRDQPNDCSSDNLASNKPMTYTVVYFVKDDTLWRRTIMPASYASTDYRCAEPWQRPSCAPAIDEAFCVTEDIKLVEGVTSEAFSVDYFTAASDSGANNGATATYGASGVATRSAALQASTTVSVALAASQTAAGHNIEQTASLRVTRLDVNASTIAPVVPDSTPSVPAITGTFDAPNKAVFTWPHSSGGNITYDVDYRINAGSWTSAATDTPTNSYTVTADHTDVVELRVRASNSTGDSSYGTDTVTIPLWVPLVLQNQWSNYEQSYSRAAYTKTRDGIVLLKGLVKRTGSVVGGETLATLPEGYRPNGTLIFGTATNPTASGRIDVNSAGEVMANSADPSWLSLETVRFVPDGRYSRTTVTPLNGWTHYGGSFSDATYVQTDAGRVVTQGLVRSGTWTSGTQIFDIPDALLPSLYLIISSRASGYGYYAVEHRTAQAEGVIARGVGSSYLSVNGIYYPASYSSWSNMTLANSWVVYGSIHATPQYTKGSDNMVVLKGLVRSGTSGTAITTLPAGYRPKERLLLTTTGADAWARIDIQPTGVISLQSGSNAWLTFDNITFMAEQ